LVIFPRKIPASASGVKSALVNCRGGGSSGINGGICQSLFGWIPFIGTYIVGLCNLILGALEIVLIIVVLAVAIWLVSKARSGRSGGGGARGGGNTVNVYAGPGQRRGRNYS